MELVPVREYPAPMTSTVRDGSALESVPPIFILSLFFRILKRAPGGGDTVMLRIILSRVLDGLVDDSLCYGKLDEEKKPLKCLGPKYESVLLVALQEAK